MKQTLLLTLGFGGVFLGHFNASSAFAQAVEKDIRRRRSMRIMPHSIQQASDGGHIVGRMRLVSLVGAGVVDAWVIKLDANGNVQWQRDLWWKRQ